MCLATLAGGSSALNHLSTRIWYFRTFMLRYASQLWKLSVANVYSLARSMFQAR